MYTALYRKWRPEVFSAMSGQTHIIRILKNQLESGQIGHAYLFCGTRGTGKTTTARIFAKGVNCQAPEGDRPCGTCENCIEIQNGNFIDVIEIDAASNNGVENIRELRESVKYPPAKGRYKVYIIDEVHMLSSGAFNALLKTLEEPPSHVIFILATTEIHKLPATILSRCLRLDFRRLSEKEIIEKLQEICSHNKIEAEDSALSLVASNADGAMRDALSILDQCFSAAPDKVTRKDVVDILGTAGEDIFIEITDTILEKSAPLALRIIERIAVDGKDIRQFLKDWIFHFRNLMIAKYADNLEDIISLSCENIEKIKAQSKTCTMEFINYAIRELSQTSNDARWSSQPRTLLELSAVKLTDLQEELSIDALAARVADLEKNGVRVQSVSDTPSKLKSVNNEQTVINEPVKPSIKPDVRKQAPSVPSDLSSCEDLDKLWSQIFKEGVAKKITFNMLGKGVGVSYIDDKVIRFEAESAPKVTSVEQNAEMIRDIVEKLTGKNVKVECSLKGAGPAQASAPSKTPENDKSKDILENYATKFNVEITD